MLPNLDERDAILVEAQKNLEGSFQWWPSSADICLFGVLSGKSLEDGLSYSQTNQPPNHREKQS